MKILNLTAIALIGFSLVACSSGPSSTGYTRAEAGSIQEVQYGRVVSARPVTIARGQSTVGTLAGTVIGGIAGSHVGKGTGKAVGSIVGAIAGAVAGSTIDKKAQSQAGVEITVRLDSGKTIAISQVADERFHVNDRVKVLQRNGKARVTH